MFKKIGHKPDKVQMIKSHNILRFYYVLSKAFLCNWNCLGRHKGSQTPFLCVFYLLFLVIQFYLSRGKLCDCPLFNNCILETNLTKLDNI